MARTFTGKMIVSAPWKNDREIEPNPRSDVRGVRCFSDNRLVLEGYSQQAPGPFDCVVSVNSAVLPAVYYLARIEEVEPMLDEKDPRVGLDI